MQKHDRLFLRDFLNFTFKNHMMVVEALLQAGSEGRRFATRTLMRANPILTGAQAEAEEAEYNEGARFQRVMFARVFAEHVAALEDFGALCFAIRNRDKLGVLREYFASGVGDVACFFDLVLKSPTLDLGEMLKLPTLAVLRTTLADAEFVIVEQHYRNGAEFVRDQANLYRQPPKEGETPSLVPLPDDWKEYVQVLLDVGEDGRRAQGLSAWAYNKLKHRFAVLESVEEFAQLPIAKDFTVVAIQKDNAGVRRLVELTRSASMGAAEIAATIDFLAEHAALD